MSVNVAFLVGRLGADPELRTTGGGTSVVNVRLATTDRVKDSGGQWTEVTDWHSVVAFGQTAEAVAKYCRKGGQVHVQGKIKARKWKDKDGNERTTTEIVAERVTFLGSKGGDDEPRTERRQEPRRREPEPEPTPYSDDDSIPF